MTEYPHGMYGDSSPVPSINNPLTIRDVDMDDNFNPTKQMQMEPAYHPQNEIDETSTNR